MKVLVLGSEVTVDCASAWGGAAGGVMQSVFTRRPKQCTSSLNLYGVHLGLTLNPKRFRVHKDLSKAYGHADRQSTLLVLQIHP